MVGQLLKIGRNLAAAFIVRQKTGEVALFGEKLGKFG